MSSKILVVDDLQSELDLICQYLTEEGYTIVTATNGAEALEKVNQNKPDAIVTDWMMPEMGGLDLARKLRKNPETADIPVVACTAKDRDVDRMWAAKQGVEAYVTKPCTKQELVSALRAAMK
ncbi:response regulator transcription factor [Acaryochloris marina NIES-2412]|uniref:response regulator transcription factor n=1 Tax=Acaryochloris marina TaxID=155978 RepID=UPI00405A36CC